jgi:GH15 family glucan-1,4-alpha-glucosidase
LDRYPDISDHGVIGDLQTAALVTTGGTVDWFCCPRFDSPSVFASLLDADRGGYFKIAPPGSGYVTKQLYFPETAMLITRFLTAGGVGEVTAPTRWTPRCCSCRWEASSPRSTRCGCPPWTPWTAS